MINAAKKKKELKMKVGGERKGKGEERKWEVDDE